MSATEHWQTANDDYLAAALAWLRLRLAYLAEHGQKPSAAAQEPPDADLAQAEAQMLAAETAEPPVAPLMMGERLGLTRLERNVLLLCAAMELDTRIPALCARAQDDPTKRYPTFALALALFDEAAWDVLSPQRPLRYFRLIEIQPAAGQPLTGSPLRGDERIVNYIKGLNHLDDRLVPLLTPRETPRVQLPPSQLRLARTILRHWQQVDVMAQLPVIELTGPDSASKYLIAAEAAAAVGRGLLHLPAAALPAQLSELEALARLWQRESLLLPVALYLDAHDVELIPAEATGQATAVTYFLQRARGLVFLATREAWPALETTAHVHVEYTPAAEQRAAWARTLGKKAGKSPALVAGQFNLDAATIERIGQEALASRRAKDSLHDRVWDLCRASTRPRLESLAQRLEPKASWDDIVLPPEAMNLLRQIADQVRRRTLVYDQWGFRDRMNRGLGISALFAGESGTGKTMAAEVLANDLQLDLYRIDLSAVVSKYIGETEKNLRKLFDAAEYGNAILFFDEADALFGKRSEVKDSHDRYANIEINYLLQRMESYGGLAILATNMKSALDTAFVRRLRFIINFPFPGPVERKLIWQKVFPARTPKAELDYDRLARLNLTGGSIHNIALNAAFLAAAEKKPRVTMALVFAAAGAEFRKLDRLVNEAELR